VLIGSHTFAVVVVVLVVLDTVLVVTVLVDVVLEEDVVEDVVKVLPLIVVEVVRELLVRVIELVLEELVVDDVIVVLVISHSLQPRHIAHVHSSDHAKALLWQPFTQAYIALVVVPGVVVITALKSIVVKVVPGDPPPPPELPPLPPLPQTSVVVVNVFVVVPSVEVELEEVNVVVVRKLKFEGGGCVVGGVGTTMFAHCPHVAQTGQPHLTNHGCPLGSQSPRHSRSCEVVVLVTGPMVIVVVRVEVVELIVVVVQTGTSRTSGVNSSV